MLDAPHSINYHNHMSKVKTPKKATRVKKISAMEARRSFGEIMNRVSLRGDTYIVERAGRPLVRIIPIKGSAFNPNDPFDNPFATFTEWNDPSNDVYDNLVKIVKK